MIGGILPGLIAALITYYLSLPLVIAYQKRRKGFLKEKLLSLKNPIKEADAAKVAAADAAPAIDGKAIYSQYCVACHGADGKGNNGLAANYVDDKTRLAQSDEALIKSIKEGKQGSVGVMPPWGGTLNDDQIKAVLGYIRAEFGEQG